MLRGRFGDTSGRPYMSAHVFVPRLDVASNISFLFDTGVDATVLMPADAERVGIDYDDLGTPALSTGDRRLGHRLPRAGPSSLRG